MFSGIFSSCIHFLSQEQFWSHHSSLLEGDINFEVEAAERKKRDDPGDDQLGQVVVVEDVVDVEAKVRRKNPDDSLVDRFGLVGFEIKSENLKLRLGKRGKKQVI